MEPFSIQFSCKGRLVESKATLQTTVTDLVADARSQLDLPDDANVKLLYKGINPRSSNPQTTPVFTSIPKKMPKIMVLMTETQVVQDLNSKRSDPTIRGLDQEIRRDAQAATTSSQKDASSSLYWGTPQDKAYKFCRFEACTWQSFGHRPTDSTPHDFHALALLERLATDPGIVAVMQTRALVVGTLGEMDPIDDRLMQQKQQQGACLLGYNTNGGQRIDVKLRTDDLADFRPYPSLVATLIHELSHNWVGEHDLLFWTNYAQMRAQYLWTHVCLRGTAVVVNGQTTAQRAQLPAALCSMEHVYNAVLQELQGEMAQHGLHPQMLAQGLKQHCDALAQKSGQTSAQTLGGDNGSTSTTATASRKNPRELALAAAERRAREQKEAEEKKKSSGDKK